MASILKNKFVKPSTGVDFNRNVFSYEKRHSTNFLSGYITPVHTQFLYPGMCPDFNFGCVIESAPLIAPCLDNIYVDVVCIWTPLRLVMTDFNEWLGESNAIAFTINRNITIPKLTEVIVSKVVNSTGTDSNISMAYLADNFLAPHLGYREEVDIDFTTMSPESSYYKGVSVLPSRIYELNWNTFFRNENLQSPILIDKTSVVGTHDQTYKYGLGHLLPANKLKTWYNVATPAPSLLDVSLALGEMMPVGVLPLASHSGSASPTSVGIPANTPFVDGVFNGLEVTTSLTGITGSSVVADLASLTVNKMYYALMEQRFANKMMKGRRAVEFYQNFFGIRNSEAGHDMPSLITHKRYQLNISQVISTAAGSNGSETTDLGQKGAFSTTGFGDGLIHNFTATEHGYLQTYLIIRGQPSLARGIDIEFTYDGLLDTYLPEFDHIGPVKIEKMTLIAAFPFTNPIWGYCNAWPELRNQNSDVAGILKPGQPLAYKTLAIGIAQNSVISSAYLLHQPNIIDRIFMFPVCYGDHTLNPTTVDEKGELYLSNRYQFITQFVVKGKYAAVLSADSEPLKLRM